MIDPVAIIKTVAPYVLALTVFIALVLKPDLSAEAKTAGTLLIGAALAVIDPSRKSPPTA